MLIYPPMDTYVTFALTSKCLHPSLHTYIHLYVHAYYVCTVPVTPYLHALMPIPVLCIYLTYIIMHIPTCMPLIYTPMYTYLHLFIYVTSLPVQSISSSHSLPSSLSFYYLPIMYCTCVLDLLSARYHSLAVPKSQAVNHEETTRHCTCI